MSQTHLDLAVSLAQLLEGLGIRYVVGGGGEVSDRQLRDVVAIMRINEESLDRTYMADTARRVDLTALLNRVTEMAEP